MSKDSEIISMPATQGQRFFMAVLNIVALFYFVLLFQVVWNWFVADILVALTYWQMFLGVFVARYIVLLNPRYSKIKINDEEYLKASLSTRVEDFLMNIFMNTFGFLIFFIINLILAYYG